MIICNGIVSLVIKKIWRKMNRMLIFFISLFMLFIGCVGSKTDPVKNKDLPEWVMNPPKLDNKYVGVEALKREVLNYQSKLLLSRLELKLLEL